MSRALGLTLGKRIELAIEGKASGKEERSEEVRLRRAAKQVRVSILVSSCAKKFTARMGEMK